jgi:hypothetical protein
MLEAFIIDRMRKDREKRESFLELPLLEIEVEIEKENEREKRDKSRVVVIEL